MPYPDFLRGLLQEKLLAREDNQLRRRLKDAALRSPSGAIVGGAGARPVHPFPGRVANCYSMTSSICASSDGEGVRPRACAVFILSTTWNLVGCSTGRLAGFAPLMILST